MLNLIFSRECSYVAVQVCTVLCIHIGQYPLMNSLTNKPCVAESHHHDQYSRHYTSSLHTSTSRHLYVLPCMRGEKEHQKNDITFSLLTDTRSHTATNFLKEQPLTTASAVIFKFSNCFTFVLLINSKQNMIINTQYLPLVQYLLHCTDYSALTNT